MDGQQVAFDYTGYNESAAVIDSSYRKGAPSETRLGINGLIPGARAVVDWLAGGRCAVATNLGRLAEAAFLCADSMP